MHYVAKIEGKRMWDDPKDIAPILKDLEENKEKITSIELTSNSIGIPCAKELAARIKNLPNLVNVNYRDIFVSRLKEDLPISLECLMRAIIDKPIKMLDLSDNALGPAALHSYEFFLKENSTLEELYLENNGLGPERSEEICNVLTSNEKMHLKKLKISRNRMENKGAMALAKTLARMKSLEHVEMFQNGIKVEGMKEIVQSLKENPNLKIIKINDNWIKEISLELATVVEGLKDLRIIDVSDSLIGSKNAAVLFKGLAKDEKLEEIYSNYNEIEKKSNQEEIMNICLGMSNLKKIELKGNEINKSLFKKFKSEFEKKKEFQINCYSEEEEDDEEDDLENVVDKMDKMKIK